MTNLMRKFLNFCDMPEISQLDSEDERLDEFMADFNLVPNSPEIIALINELMLPDCAAMGNGYICPAHKS